MNSVEITLLKYNVRDGYINIPAKEMLNFPKTETGVELIYSNNVCKAKFYVRESHHGFSRLAQLFKEHRELKPGNKLLITVIEKMRKYHLEILTGKG